MVGIGEAYVWRTVLADDFCIRERKVKETYDHRFVELFKIVYKLKFGRLKNSQTFRLRNQKFLANTVQHTHP